MHKSVKISIQPDVRLHKVNRYLYSHFAEHLGRCIYGGIWVGEDSSIENDGGIRLDTVAALKRLALPALRWPGGCFADNYHWMDGIGPREGGHSWSDWRAGLPTEQGILSIAAPQGIEPGAPLLIGLIDGGVLRI